MENPKANSILTEDILGILCIVGSPDFFNSKEDASSFMFNAYKGWNPAWSGKGKFPFEIHLAANDLPVGPESLSHMALSADSADFAKSMPSCSLYVQGIVLTTKSREEQGRQKVQSCFITFVRNAAGIKKRILFVNGAINFLQETK